MQFLTKIVVDRRLIFRFVGYSHLRRRASDILAHIRIQPQLPSQPVAMARRGLVHLVDEVVGFGDGEGVGLVEAGFHVALDAGEVAGLGEAVGEAAV